MAQARLAASLRHIGVMVAENDVARSDADLLAAFLKGEDASAFTILVKRHAALVLGVCRRELRSTEDAEDAFQATFLLLAQRAGSIRKRESLASWLHGTAYRMARNARRAANRRLKREAKARDTEEQSPFADLAWREVQALLDAEIDALPASYRAAFILRFLDGRSLAEGAGELHITTKAFERRLARARHLLQQRLAARGVSLSAMLALVGVMGDMGGSEAAAVSPVLVSATVEAARAGAAGAAVRGQITGLMNEVIREMSVKKVKLFAACMIPLALAAGGTALWFGHGDTETERPDSAIVASVSEEPGASSSSGSGSAWIELVAKNRGKLFEVGAGQVKWEDLIEWFADISGLTYAEGAVKPTGAVALVPPKSPPKEFTLGQIVDLLNEKLLARKAGERYLLIRREFTFTFVPADEVVNANIPRLVTEDQLADCGQTEVVKIVIPLTTVVAKDVAPDLKPLKSSFGTIAAIPPNSLFVIDTARVIRFNILPCLTPCPHQDVDQYSHICKYTSALTAKRLLVDRLKGANGKEAVPGLTVAVNEERNQVIVAGPTDLVSRAKAILIEYDVER